MSCVAAAIEMLGLFFTNGFGVLGVADDVARCSVFLPRFDLVGPVLIVRTADLCDGDICWERLEWEEAP